MDLHVSYMNITQLQFGHPMYIKVFSDIRTKHTISILKLFVYTNLSSYKKMSQIYLFFKVWSLKELYTSISTLAQILVLILLNNEVVLRIRNSNPFMFKNPKIFSVKDSKRVFKVAIAVYD